MQKITINKEIKASPEQVFTLYLDPEANRRWSTAGYGWSTGFVNIDPVVGGKWESEYKSPDGENDFIFGGTYTEIVPNHKIAYIMPASEESPESREAEVLFEKSENGTLVTINFDGENQNPVEMQQAGWQAILDNFAKFVERKTDPNYKTIQKSIDIKSDLSKVWFTLIDNETYPKWAGVFYEGSYYQGEMKYDNTVKFVGPEGTGIKSLVKVFIPNFQVSFEHQVSILENVESTDPNDIWKGLRETYTLTENSDNSTKLEIYTEAPVDFYEYFDETWSKAMEIIKELAEKNS